MKMPNVILKEKIYLDHKGRTWRVTKESLPKIRGMYKYWLAECMTHDLAFREDTISKVITKLKTI
jgi:hypothetical protein